MTRTRWKTEDEQELDLLEVEEEEEEVLFLDRLSELEPAQHPLIHEVSRVNGALIVSTIASVVKFCVLARERECRRVEEKRCRFLAKLLFAGAV